MIFELSLMMGQFLEPTPFDCQFLLKPKPISQLYFLFSS